LVSRLQILAAAVLWSTAGAAIKLCELEAWQIALGRSLVAALAILALLPESRRLPSRRAWKVSVAYAATVTLFVLATKFTTAANAIFIQDTAPLYVLVLSPLLLKEFPTRGELLAAPIFIFGLALFFLDQLEPGHLRGNLLALGSGVAFAFSIMGLRAVNAEGAAVLVWGNLLAALVSLPGSI